MHSNNLTDTQLEIVGLLQEELAEIIQELSKIRRSGTHFKRNGKDIPNIVYLNREVLDTQLLFDLGSASGLFSSLYEYPEETNEYIAKKKERLKEWTNIPHYLIESI